MACDTHACPDVHSSQQKSGITARKSASGAMAASTSAAEGISPCSVNIVPIQIMAPGFDFWQMVDWIIPAGRLAYTSATPLAITRDIVRAAGGMLESPPDGSVVARPRYPTDILAGGNSYERVLADDAIFTLGEQAGQNTVFNAIVVGDGADEASGGANDRLEYEADAADAHAGTVFGFPDPWRPVTLVHTSRDVEITPGGIETHEETETLEIIAGTAETRYPVFPLLACQYRYADLGAVLAEGRQIVTATPAYSLLEIRYTWRAYAWRVRHPADEEVQFLLMEL
jgi:hypothetical protein